MNIIFLTVGVIVGSLITIAIQLIRTSHGTLEIDMTNPKEPPYLRCSFGESDFNKLPKKKYVTMKIDPTADFTRRKQGL